MSEAKKKLTSATDELMQALNISEDDIRANNDGYITEHQHESLVAPDAGAHGNLAAVGCLLSIIALGMVVIAGGLAVFSAPMQDIGILSLGASILFVIAIGLVLLARSKKRLLSQELAQGDFVTIQGVAVVRLDDNASWVEINDEKFDLDKDVLSRIKHLEPYVVHYLPKSKTVLSMEQLTDDPNFRKDDVSSK